MKATFVNRSIHIRLIGVAGAILALALLLTQTVKAQPGRQIDFYTVQDGDTWASIALRFGVAQNDVWKANGVVNPGQLASGQRLYIPNGDAVSLDTSTLIFEVKQSTSVQRAALSSGNALINLLAFNGLSNSALALGQTLYAPDRRDDIQVAAATPEPTTPPTPEPAPTTEETQEADNEPVDIPEGALLRSHIGVQGHFLIDDTRRERLLDLAAYNIEFGWVKQQVPWDQIEYGPDQYSDVMLDSLDKFVDDAFNRKVNIMLSIVKAPDWARSTTEEDGPPINYEDYNDFVKFIVLRYKGKIDAIEIWNEPNLGREWRGGTLNGAEYVRLLAGAYNTIKTVYPEGNITVISAGLAPTGVNDGVTAVDDRTYFRQMYEAGVQNWADAIGIHPYGWGNPPWTRCCGDWGGAPTHNNDPTFFFLNTIEDYRAIQEEFGDGNRKLWATEFGWGTMDGLDRPIPEDSPFFAYVDQGKQADYIVEAFRMGQDMDFMGPMILWNLNIAIFQGSDNSQSGYSILELQDRPREAFRRLRDTPKVDDLNK